MTWSADDGRGNNVTGVQRVVVNALSSPNSLLDAIREGIVQLQAAVIQSQVGISECSLAEECPVDFGALVASVDQLIQMTCDAVAEAGNRATLKENGEGEDYAALLADLEAARENILEAVAALEESNGGDPDAAAMQREQAIGHLVDAGAKLDDAAYKADAMHEDPGSAAEGDEGGEEGTDEPNGDDDAGPEELGGSDVDENPQTGETNHPVIAARRSGPCGLGMVLVIVCLPLLVVWKACRKCSPSVSFRSRG
ncbi:MAG: hypothetical protein KAV82_09810 [Phycisphaerae bacterium]|nr:hypothetical protein [Phycisphaerae bacterium]